MKYFTDQEWAKLSRSQRRKWWEATKYGKVEPSEQLVRELKAAANSTATPTNEDG